MKFETVVTILPNKIDKARTEQTVALLKELTKTVNELYSNLDCKPTKVESAATAKGQE